MKNSFALNSAKLALLFSLVLACGCQNELASTERVKPERASYVTPPKARGLSASKEVELDRIVSDGLHDSQQVNWEADVSDNGNKSEPPNLDEVFNLESTELGKLTGDASESENFLK